jgi:N utilization substance protein B
MIIRRNIRINVLLTIYEQIQQNDTINRSAAQNSLNDKFSQTSSLFTSLWHLVVLTADYVLIHANQKASKHRPTEADLNVSSKIISNSIIQDLKKNILFEESVKLHKSHLMFDTYFVRAIFIKLVESEFYKKYIAENQNSIESDKELIENLLNEIILKNDIASSFIAEKYINYEMDVDMVQTWTEKVLKNPKNFAFNKIISTEKLEFSHDLLDTYYDKKEVVFELIEPKLIGWDAERVAILDLIILHLGICEMLYFPSIPLRVTINEYIDLAKGYSTPQSGQFVNGLLDNVKKDLEAQNKIHKNDFIKKERK